ncbi:MAG: hypothetical protein ACLGIO_11255 [Acidimicrobiia bacterium]
MALDVLAAPLPELTAAACEVRDAAHGRRVTWSPKVFIPLTRLCRDRCGYCTFATAPARVDAPYLDPDQVLAVAGAGAAAGCAEALFTLGERPELRYPAAATWRPGGATPRPSTTWPPCAPWCGTRRACSPTPMPAPCSPASWPACARSARPRG